MYLVEQSVYPQAYLYYRFGTFARHKTTNMRNSYHLTSHRNVRLRPSYFEANSLIISTMGWLKFVPLVMLLFSLTTASTPQSLCGGELVDALYFVCGDRPFVFTVNRDSNKKTDLVEECCFRQCFLSDLEKYCLSPTAT